MVISGDQPMISIEKSINKTYLYEKLNRDPIAIYYDRENFSPCCENFMNKLNDFVDDFGKVNERIAVSKDWIVKNKIYSKEIYNAGFELQHNPFPEEKDFSDKMLETKINNFISLNKDIRLIVILSGDHWFLDVIDRNPNIEFLIVSNFDNTKEDYQNLINAELVEYKSICDCTSTKSLNQYEKAFFNSLTDEFASISIIGARMRKQIADYDIKKGGYKQLKDLILAMENVLEINVVIPYKGGYFVKRK